MIQSMGISLGQGIMALNMQLARFMPRGLSGLVAFPLLTDKGQMRAGQTFDGLAWGLQTCKHDAMLKN